MKKGLIIAIVVVLIIAGLVLLLVSLKGEKAPGYCSIDSDCVPASCCHQSSCVAKAQAPQCKGIMCIQVSEPGTLDCGQGSCTCENNKCEVKLSK